MPGDTFDVEGIVAAREGASVTRIRPATVDGVETYFLLLPEGSYGYRMRFGPPLWWMLRDWIALRWGNFCHRISTKETTNV